MNTHPSQYGVIKTDFVNPPIPHRGWDWCAFLEGQEDDGPHGSGYTEAEAIAHLKEQLEEIEDPETPSNCHKKLNRNEPSNH